MTTPADGPSPFPITGVYVGPLRRCASGSPPVAAGCRTWNTVLVPSSSNARMVHPSDCWSSSSLLAASSKTPRLPSAILEPEAGARMAIEDRHLRLAGDRKHACGAHQLSSPVPRGGCAHSGRMSYPVGVRNGPQRARFATMTTCRSGWEGGVLPLWTDRRVARANERLVLPLHGQGPELERCSPRS